MRIVVVADAWYPDTVGGSERYVRETAVRLAARGHQVLVWTLRNRHAGLPAREHDEGMIVRRHGRVGAYRIVPRTAFMLGTGRRAARAAAGADLILTHHVWSAAAVGLPRPPAPILHTFHASPILEWRYNEALGGASERLASGPLARLRPLAHRGYRRALLAAENRMVGQADRLVALSEFTRSLLADQHPNALARLAIVPGGVDTHRFQPAGDRPALRARLGLAPTERVVLSVRRMVPRMGLEELIRAAARLAPTYPELRLVLVGDGPLRPTLQAQAEAAGLAATIRFTGRIDDAALADHYRAADLFAIPTQAYEGFGLVTLEALASGTPVVGTPAGATPEILGGLDRGLVARDTGAAAIADTLGTWLDRDLAPMRARARRHAEGYDWERIVDRYEALCLQTSQRV